MSDAPEVDRPRQKLTHLGGRPDWLPFILVEGLLASPIGLAAAIAIFQLIKAGAVSPETDFWLRWTIMGLGGIMISVAAIQMEAAE